MNLKYFSLINYTLTFLINFISNFRQLLAFKTDEVPKNCLKFKNIWDINVEEFKKNKDYNSEKLRFQIFKSIVVFIMTFYLWNSDFYVYLWDICSKYFGYYYLVIFIFILIDSLIQEIIGLLFGFYLNFYIEEKWGFNKYKVSLFLKDSAHDFIFGNVIQFILLSVLTLIINYLKDSFFIVSITFVTIFILLIQLIFPIFILPLKYDLKNLDTENSKEKELTEKIDSLLGKYKFPKAKIYKIDSSKRSTKSNAFFTGLFKSKKLILFDSLFNILEVNEIHAVIYHELGHCMFNHLWKLIGLNILPLSFIFYFLSLFFDNINLYKDFGFNNKDYFIAIFIFLSLTFSFCMLLFSIINNFFSRKFEYQADKFAFDNNETELLKIALVKLHKDSKSNLLVDKLYALLNYSHPVLVERLNYLDNLESKRK